MSKVVLATGNPGKVAEMQAVLQEFGLEILPQSNFNIPEAIEDGLSFVENAIIKARHACHLTRLPAIADDSGLEVDALDGAPGIYSSRYADGLGDQANNLKLLAALAGHANRAARFQCVLVFMRHKHDPTPIICQGTWEGEIATQAAGENGFGYDPLFYLPDHDCNSAELDPTIKKQLSHRAKALALLKNQLKNSI
jgi:XTP/dITP diphosphohydrolase